MAHGPNFPTRNSSTRYDTRLSFLSGAVPVGACLHTTFGVSSEAWLRYASAEAGKPASADWLIERDGTRVSLTPEGRRPYHAGISEWLVRGKVLRNAELSAALVGIEMEASASQRVTDAQIDSVASLIVELAPRYGWRWPFYILGHYEIAKPLGRRSDPHGFDWGDFIGRLYYHSRQARIGGLDY